MHLGRVLLGGALALGGVVVVAQGQEEPEEPQGPMSFQDVVSQHRNLTRFQSTLEAFPDLAFMLSAVSGLTVLAPSDEAFDKLAVSSLGPIFEANDTAAIRNVLAYHVLNGTYAKNAFNSTFQFPGTLLIDEALEKVSQGQKVAVVQQSGGEVVLVSGLGSRSSVRRAVSSTIRLLPSLKACLHHYPQDLSYTNGILHIIDSFLVPPEPFMNTSIRFNATAAAGAVTKAELEEYVDTTPDLTVFAPNNAAFERIGSGLANMTVEELGRLLSYHVVNGTVAYTSTLRNGTVLRSVQGNSLTISVGGNALYVNSAQILQQDLLLSNGVLHIIEKYVHFTRFIGLDHASRNTTPCLFTPSHHPS